LLNGFWPRRHRFWWGLIVVLGISLSLRMGYAIRAFSLGTSFVPDSQSYLVPAENLRHGVGYLNKQMAPEITRPPGYPGFLAAILMATKGGLRSALMIQVAILSFIPVIGFVTAWMLFGYRVGLTSSLLLALSPWSIAWDTRFCSDGLAMLFLALMLLWMAFMARFEKSSPKVKLAEVLLGLSTAAYVLTRPLWPIILFVVLSVWLVQRGLPTVRRAAALLVVSIFAVTPVAIWTLRNARVAGVVTVSDIGVKTAYWYWAQRVQAFKTGQDRFVLKNEAMRESGTWRGTPDEIVKQYAVHAAQILVDNPLLAFEAFIRDMAEQLVHPDAVTVFSGLGLEVRYGTIILAGLWVLVLLTSARGGWVVIRSWRQMDSGQRGALLGMTLVISIIVLSSGVSFGGGSRLRLPAELLLSVLAALGIGVMSSLDMVRHRFPVSHDG
jgi:hypothetical protein